MYNVGEVMFSQYNISLVHNARRVNDFILMLG